MTGDLSPALDNNDKPLIHPALVLVPEVQGDEFEGLIADIVSVGLLRAGVLDSQGHIVDGRARMAACEIAEVEMRWERLSESESAVEAVIGHNVQGRHLTTGQRALLALRVWPLKQEEAKARQGARHDLDPTCEQNCTEVGGGRASAWAAAMVGGVSATTVDQVRRVEEQAPDLIPQIEAGMAPDRAVRILKKRSPRPPPPLSPARLIQTAKGLPATLDTLARQLDAALAIDHLPFDFDQWTKMQSNLDPILCGLDALRDVLASSPPPKPPPQATRPPNPATPLTPRERFERENPGVKFGPPDPDAKGWHLVQTMELTDRRLDRTERRFEVDVIVDCPLDDRTAQCLAAAQRSAQVVRFSADGDSIRLTVNVKRDKGFVSQATREVAKLFPNEKLRCDRILPI